MTNSSPVFPAVPQRNLGFLCSPDSAVLPPVGMELQHDRLAGGSSAHQESSERRCDPSARYNVNSASHPEL